MKKEERVHLKSRNGIYTVISKSATGFIVTAKCWHGETKFIPWDDFKCFEGKKRYNV